MTSTPILAPPGLKGVQVASTAIGAVRGDEGYYHYRHHEATGLARTQSLEAIWQLLLDGELPTASDAAEFAATVGSSRVLSSQLLTAVELVGANTQRPHLGALACLPLLIPNAQPTLDSSTTERRSDAIRVCSALPTVLAALARIQIGLDPIAPDPNKSHAADWLNMAGNTEATDLQVRAVETYLSLTIDHGFNASTFAARVVTSTGADVVAAMSAGIGALSGPLHGGAPSRALSMIEEIGDPSKTEDWVVERLQRGERIMGFGHAVYRAEDPRSVLLKEIACEFDSPLVDRAVEIEERILTVMRRWKPDSVIVTNVEFYAGIVLHLAGLAPEMFTPSFMVSRAIGWGAHIVEQASDNKIMRPSARYVGRAPSC